MNERLHELLAAIYYNFDIKMIDMIMIVWSLLMIMISDDIVTMLKHNNRSSL